jgi:hypothetical protein
VDVFSPGSGVPDYQLQTLKLVRANMDNPSASIGR